ncbi:RNA polymerase sigma factor [Amnibacterium setariae]|uniref:Sigma-70 family RNA polymerase sigma factor n=1 Tax=Amnibacterium setariae TaxID=2306585 RepID=A0A3A1TY18_9MICO|nr:sigma-70 family RNA polymerase sigma factor [Amnibacterium setariae]RIX28660.1 sigma-70 family RNA polymerase sigma factor [Amnibacterium setariae]
MDDHDLLARVRDRDERALAQLRARYQPQLLARIDHVTLNRDLTEEVAQDLWLQLWQRPDMVDLTRGGFGTWLRTVAHRRAVDCVRSVQAARTRDLGYGLRQAHEVDYGPEQHAALAWYRPHLKAALAQLSDYQRTALLMHHFDDLSHVEIAHQLEIAAGASRTRYRDGLRRLRQILQDTAGAPT